MLAVGPIFFSRLGCVGLQRNPKLPSSRLKGQSCLGRFGFLKTPFPSSYSPSVEISLVFLDGLVCPTSFLCAQRTTLQLPLLLLFPLFPFPTIGLWAAIGPYQVGLLLSAVVLSPAARRLFCLTRAAFLCTFPSGRPVFSPLFFLTNQTVL